MKNLVNFEEAKKSAVNTIFFTALMDELLSLRQSSQSEYQRGVREALEAVKGKFGVSGGYVARRSVVQRIERLLSPSAPEPEVLPTGEAFYLARDEDGHYLLKSRTRSGLIAHGDTFAEAEKRMVWLWRSMKKMDDESEGKESQ